MVDIRQPAPPSTEEWLPYRSVIRYAIGGGWGKENPETGTVPVRVIRGTDFKNIHRGNLQAVPLRYETSRRIGSRQLEDGDAILEISGGSRTSNQFTGRSFLVTQNLLDRLGGVVIPASFCRLVRFDEDRMVPKYAYYALQNMYLTGRAALYEQQSTGISNFQFEYFLDEEILRVPPLPEQRAIAQILGSFDDKIELNRQLNETLEGLARAIFKDWFIDFGPVRAKLEGRDAGLPEHLAELFPDRLVESELGGIPEGWGVKTLGELIELAYGKALKAADRKGGTIPVYGSNGQIGWHDKGLVAGPGIVVGRKGNPGIVTWAHSDFFPIDTAFYVVPRDAGQKLPFLFFALAAQDLPSIAADSAVPGLSRKLAYMNRQVVPDKVLVDKFSGYADTIFARRHRLEEESRTLAALRDTLLPELMSGEIRLAEAEQAMEAEA